VNSGAVRRVLGELLVLEAILLLLPLLVALYAQQGDAPAFLVTICLTAAAGVALILASPPRTLQIGVREGLTIVTLGWILLSLLGALPFVLSGSTTTYVDAFFETVSGFTTTGATLIGNPEGLPSGILFWRSFTHWVGGMGILVFTLALVPALGVGGFQLFKAESPGPVADKIAPRLRDTARILYLTYIGMTLLQIILLTLGGMSLFDSILHTFGTVGTGGFSTRSSSIGAYTSTYIHWVITIFMLLSGVNFSLYFALYRGRWRDVLRNEELRLYLGVVVVSALLIGMNILSDYRHQGLALRDSFFQVSSIITTTGYATADFDLWPAFSKLILLFLMLMGASAGSTAGGIKQVRFVVLFKLIKREIAKTFHPRGYIPIKLNGKSLSSDTVSGITSFLALYALIFVVGVLLISLEGIDLESAISSVACTLSNIGPGFGVVGPTRTFSEFGAASKLVFAALMLLGRLELFTVVAWITPQAWRHRS
jgi:trk system potassium uptake protein TrkH